MKMNLRREALRVLMIAVWTIAAFMSLKFLYSAALSPQQFAAVTVGHILIFVVLGAWFRTLFQRLDHHFWGKPV